MYNTGIFKVRVPAHQHFLFIACWSICLSALHFLFPGFPAHVPKHTQLTWD